MQFAKIDKKRMFANYVGDILREATNNQIHIDVVWLDQKITQYSQNIETPFLQYIAIDYFDANYEMVMTCGNDRRWLFITIASAIRQHIERYLPMTLPRNIRERFVFSVDTQSQYTNRITVNRILYGENDNIILNTESNRHIHDVIDILNRFVSRPEPPPFVDSDNLVPSVNREIIPHCDDRDNCEICHIEDKTCPVCHENIQDKFNFAVTNCNHLYCKPCIDRCISGGNCICPMCRSSITTLQIHDQDPEQEQDQEQEA
jgi:hypothetical protein